MPSSPRFLGVIYQKHKSLSFLQHRPSTWRGDPWLCATRCPLSLPRPVRDCGPASARPGGRFSPARPSAGLRCSGNDRFTRHPQRIARGNAMRFLVRASRAFCASRPGLDPGPLFEPGTECFTRSRVKPGTGSSRPGSAQNGICTVTSRQSGLRSWMSAFFHARGQRLIDRSRARLVAKPS